MRIRSYAEPAGVLLVLTGDGLVRRAVEQLAGEVGLAVLDAEPASGPAPLVTVVDLEQPGSIEEIARLRRRYPQALLAGHLVAPRRDLWLEAERAGCDLVSNRGALVARLRKTLESWHGPARPRFALFELAEAAGRLGLVFRREETPVGPVAVYRVGSALVAASDVCPHAGARLSEGELEGSVVTCPRHGSRFDVRSGERLRGPADLPLPTFTLLEDGGFLYLLLPA